MELIGSELLAMTNMRRGLTASSRRVLFFSGAIPDSIESMPFSETDIASMFQSNHLCGSFRFAAADQTIGKHVTTRLTGGQVRSGYFGMQSLISSVYVQRADRVYLSRALSGVYGDVESGLISKNPLLSTLFLDRPIVAKPIQTLFGAFAALETNGFFYGTDNVSTRVGNNAAAADERAQLVFEYDVAQSFNRLLLMPAAGTPTTSIGVRVYAFDEATETWTLALARTTIGGSTNTYATKSFTQQTAKIWRVTLDHTSARGSAILPMVLLGNSANGVNPNRAWTRGNATWGLIFPDMPRSNNLYNVGVSDRLPIQLIKSGENFPEFDPSNGTAIPALVTSTLRYR